MNKKLQMTTEEAREKFLLTLWQILDYWDKQPNKSKREALEGMMHTFLASGIDGCSLNLPPMELKPIISDEDKRYYEDNEEKYLPGEDIGGGLHEIMYKVGRKYKFVKE